MRELSRAFDLTITVADSALALHPITGSFADESVDEVLDDVAGIVGGSYDRVGRTVIIRRHGSGVERHGGRQAMPLTTAQTAMQTIVPVREPRK